MAILRDSVGRLCRANPVGDSSCEPRMVAGPHRLTHPPGPASPGTGPAAMKRPGSLTIWFDPNRTDQTPPDQEIASVTAHGAFATHKCHDSIATRGSAAILPPRKAARPRKPDTPGALARSKTLCAFPSVTCRPEVQQEHADVADLRLPRARASKQPAARHPAGRSTMNGRQAPEAQQERRRGHGSDHP